MVLKYSFVDQPLNSIPYLRLIIEVFDEFLSWTKYDLPIYDLSMSIYLYKSMKS